MKLRPVGGADSQSAASRFIGTKLVSRIFGLLRSFALELSDENAYQRHLQLTGHPDSATEWRAFSDQRQHRKYQNAKCC